jgi:hypothetical protein
MDDDAADVADKVAVVGDVSNAHVERPVAMAIAHYPVLLG